MKSPGYWIRVRHSFGRFFSSPQLYIALFGFCMVWLYGWVPWVTVILSLPSIPAGRDGCMGVVQNVRVMC